MHFVWVKQKLNEMNKIVAFFMIALFSTTAKAQNVEIKSNAFGMIFGAYNVTAEFRLEQNPSITVLASAWYNTEDFKEWAWSGRDGGLSLGARQYFNRFEDQGVFIGLASRYIPNSYTYTQGYWDQNGNWVQTESVTERDDYASLGFTLGYKYIYNDKITIDAFFGGGRIVYEQIENSWGPAEFISGFNFGYRF